MDCGYRNRNFACRIADVDFQFQAMNLNPARNQTLKPSNPSIPIAIGTSNSSLQVKALICRVKIDVKIGQGF